MKKISFRLDSWRGRWFGLAALPLVAALLWVGFALALVLGVLAGAGLMASRIRRSWTRNRAPRGPLVIEGQYTKVGR